MKRLLPAVILAVGCFLTLALPCFSDDLKDHPTCKYCGMDRQMFAHSRMLVEYDDGSTVGTCSLHCLAIDLVLNIDKTPKGFFVGDYNGRTLIDAEKAFWIIGGSKPGVMTKRAKWAFEKKEAADKFLLDNGGTQAMFDAALQAAYQDIGDDTKMIRERRKLRRPKMMEKKE